MKKWLIGFLGLALRIQAQSSDSLLQVLQKTPVDTHRVSVLFELGNSFWKQSDDSLARIYLNQAVKLGQKLNHPRREADARLLLVRIETDYQTDLTTANANLAAALKIALSLRDKSLEGQTYYRRAQLYNSNLDKQKEIRPLLQKALTLFEETREKNRQAVIYEEIALLTAREGKLPEAIDLQLKARRIQEEIGDRKALQFTLANLGHNYVILGRYDNALQCFKEAETLAKKLNDARVLPYAMMQRGDILEKQAKFANALKVFQDAAAIYEKTKSAVWLPRIYARIGKMYIQLQDYDRALRYTRQSDSLYKSQKDYEELLDHMSQANFGEIYLAKKQYAKVISYASEGLEYTANMHFPRETAEYHRQLAEAFEHLGQDGKALYHFKEYKAQSDSVFNETNEQKITVSSMTYDFEKKQQADKLNIERLKNDKLNQTRNFLIGLSVIGFLLTLFILWSNRKLKHKNEELLNKNREIEEALFKGQKIERKRVASELHDNLNTKLAALRWRLEALDVSKYRSGDQKIHQSSLEMLEDIYGDVRLISHSMIPSELETDGLLPALHKLVGQLNINSRIAFHLVDNSLPVRPSSMIEHQLYNIALELINNVLKHAQASQVWISVGQTDNALTLTVSDDGVGLQENPDSDGMGMQNLANRVEALNGKLLVESTPGKGLKIGVEVELN
jgi:signal transduction histidine kinase